MILGDIQRAGGAADGGRTTLDDLFRRAAARRPEALAICDPPNRDRFTDGAPRRLTYAQADSAISATAAKLRGLSLPADAVIGIQLPNMVESVLTLLGVLRAGMIPAPLPLLWRRGDIVSALGHVGAKALITCRRVGAVDHARLARQAAAEVFPIRYVCAFGGDLPDGVISLDDVYAGGSPAPVPRLDDGRDGNLAAHVALITWDVTDENLVPVARNHVEVIAGGLAILLEGRLAADAVLLSALPPSSFAGVAMTVLPWLLTGGTLALHQPFDPETLAQQLGERCAAAILPAPVVPRVAAAGFFGAHVGTVMGLWRSPERMRIAIPWREKATRLVDVAAFGEACLIPARRGASGKPAPIPFGAITAPRGAPAAVFVAQVTRTKGGTIALRGPMVPRHAFPPGAERAALPHFKSADGVVDTGYACRVDPDAQTLVVTGPPVGIAGVGGYRFAVRELQRLITNIDSGSRIAALPDALSGHRLAGSAADSGALRTALIRQGVNPLVADAFGAS